MDFEREYRAEGRSDSSEMFVGNGSTMKAVNRISKRGGRRGKSGRASFREEAAESAQKKLCLMKECYSYWKKKELYLNLGEGGRRGGEGRWKNQC